jgi:hypothetical protein
VNFKFLLVVICKNLLEPYLRELFVIFQIHAFGSNGNIDICCNSLGRVYLHKFVFAIDDCVG